MLKLNLGCGSNFNASWENLDFAPKDPSIIQCDLSQGIPYANESVDTIYHSHLLEHFSLNKAHAFIKECYRVLKPRGIIRVVVPDLEQIVLLYLEKLKNVRHSKTNAQADYEWAMVELIDQLVRKESGGLAKKILSRTELTNEAFIYERWGEEARSLRQRLLNKSAAPQINKSTDNKKTIRQRISNRLKKIIFKSEYDYIEKQKNNLKQELDKVQLANFIQSGELHNWMYDSYSLRQLLEDCGFIECRTLSAKESSIPNWPQYNIDTTEAGTIRKPDSLFMEARK